MTYNTDALATARHEIGVSEVPDGSNNGPRIRIYMMCTWLPIPLPGRTGWYWCVAFWQWVMKQIFGKAFPYRTASCWELSQYLKARKCTTTSPQPGDAAILSGYRHITLYNKRINEAEFEGLGGNQNNRVQISRYRYNDVVVWLDTSAIAQYMGLNPKRKRKVKPWEVVKQEDGSSMVVFRGKNLNKAMNRAANALRKGAKKVTIRKGK